MKFDLIISNPPYNQNLHLRILNEILSLSDNVCTVQPVSWLYEKKTYESPLQKEIKRIKENIQNRLQSVYIFNGNDIFSNIIIGPCGVLYIQKNSTNVTVDDKFIAFETYTSDINDIDVHGNSMIYQNIKHKILSYCKHKNVYMKQDSVTGNFFISGRSGRLQDYKIIKKESINNYKYHQNRHNFKHCVSFRVDDNHENFHKYLKLKLVIFSLSLYKIGRDKFFGEFASVPYMPTYERPWTDEDVAKELGLTDEELAWAINWIPDYYPEDKEKYGIYKIK